MVLKLWQNKKDQNLFEMPTKNNTFFSVARCKKDIIFGGRLKQIMVLLISLGFSFFKSSKNPESKIQILYKVL